MKLVAIGITLIGASVVCAHAAESSAAAQVTGKLMFHSPLVWVGAQEPPESESAEMLAAINTFEVQGVKAGLAAFEDFLGAHPESAWAASLHLNLAEFYRSRARFTPALAHWEAAWNLTKGSKDAQIQKIAARSVAGWTKLLVGLGHKDKLEATIKEVKERKLRLGAYGTMMESAQMNLTLMKLRPEQSYRCGSYALGHVARKMNVELKSDDKLFLADSPEGGFRLSQLLDLSERRNVGLKAVRRPVGAEIVVPSVVHWKQNHYAAIVEKKGGRYKVIDSAFVPHVWVDAETIDAEASGVFLVPKGKAPGNWGELGQADAAKIYGKGWPNDIPDDEDDNCDGCCPCDEEDEDEDPPAANDGPGDGDEPECEEDCGMPAWSISEPYTTMWLKDTPLMYRRPNGQWKRLTLKYKHRANPRNNAAEICGFGPKWDCNWLGMLTQNTNTPDVAAYYPAGGGLRTMDAGGGLDYKSGRRFQINTAGEGGGGGSGLWSGVLGPIVISPTGAKIRYGHKIGYNDGVTNFFPTHRIDRYGRATLYNYQTIGRMVRLTSMVDRDGRTTTLSYDNATFTNLITSVTDPYNRTTYFHYDDLGQLTEIVDMKGITNAFQLDGDGVITNMITPYGQTKFQSYVGISTNYDNSQRRALVITEASGDEQLYQYCDNGPLGVSRDGYSYWRNSYHWDRAQYAAIKTAGITNILDLPDNYYSSAGIRHWLHGAIIGETYRAVSDTMDAAAGPPDAWGNRHARTFQYQGQSGVQTGVLKRVTGLWAGSGNQTAGIDRNELGRPTTIAYYYDGVARTYTNTYDSSGRFLQEVRGPRGELVRGYGYHSTITNLLTSVTNALGEVTRYTHDLNTLKVTSVTLPSGVVRSNLYYESGPNVGFLRQQIELGLRTNSYGYVNGNLAAETNELGLVKTYLYDNLNRLISTTFPDETTISNVYDRLDLVGVKDRLNQWTYYGYNGVRQLVAVTNAAGQVTTYDYCGCGSPSESTRWNGGSPVTTRFYHDVAGQLTNVTYPDGHQINYTYNSDNLVESVADDSGHELRLYYKQLGNKPTIYTATLGGSTLFIHTFDEYGRIRQTVDRNNVTVTNDYDFLGRLVARQVFGTSGEQTRLESFGYDTNGLVSYTDVLGQITRYVRDAAGKVLFETNANNEVLRFTYNPADGLLSLTDGNGHTTRWNYDEYGRVTNKMDAANNVLFVYKYDPLDRLTNRWSAAKSNTVYKYDPVGNLTNVVYASGNTPNIILRYDGLNRLTNMVDAIGATAFGWTDGDQLASEDGPWPSDTVTYSYTSRLRTGLNVQQPNATAWTQSYSYDDLMLLSRVASPAGEFIYTYGWGTFASDRVQNIALPTRTGFSTIENQYDGLARLMETKLKRGVEQINVHRYAYDDGNQRTQQVWTVENGVSHLMNYTYDPIGQLKTARGYEADGTTARLQEQFGYAYDAAWNLSQRTNHALVQTFNVNSLNELTTATRSGTLTVAGSATEKKGGYAGWGDPAGVSNVVVSGTGLSSGEAEVYMDGSWARPGASLADGNNTYTATANDTYGRSSQDSVSVNLPATSTFVYDLNGNLRTNNTRIFDYDDENQLIRITEPGAWKSEFSYDGLMRRRVRKEFTWSGGAWLKTNEVRYVYDMRLVIQERDANNLPQVSYTRGADLSGSLEGAGGIGGLLARIDHRLLTVGDSRACAYYHCDGNGNVTMLVDTNGQPVARYTYDPYGNILSMSGPLAEANVYRFSGCEFSANATIYYFGVRFYSPALQKWPNQDPLGDIGSLVYLGPSLMPESKSSEDPEEMSDEELVDSWTQINRNLYGAIGNNPINAIDPFGLSPSLNPANQAAAAECMETAAQAGARKLAQEAAEKLAKKAAEKAAKEAAKQLKKQIKKAEKMMRSDKKFRDWVHREWKPKVPKDGCNRNLTPEELAEALEHYVP